MSDLKEQMEGVCDWWATLI